LKTIEPRAVPGSLVVRSIQQSRKKDKTMPTGKNTEALRAQELLAGVQKHFATQNTLIMGSASYTPAEIEAQLQTTVDLRAAVNAAKVATKAKLMAEAAQAAKQRSLIAVLSAYVKVAYSQSPDVLADFGLKPRKATTPLTNEQNALAAAKRAATRAARHTMGAKQKKSVKGDVTGVLVTPIHAPLPVVSTVAIPGPATPITPALSAGAPVPKPTG
jgi:hypothetical protein